MTNRRTPIAYTSIAGVWISPLMISGAMKPAVPKQPVKRGKKIKKIEMLFYEKHKRKKTMYIYIKMHNS